MSETAGASGTSTGETRLTSGEELLYRQAVRELDLDDGRPNYKMFMPHTARDEQGQFCRKSHADSPLPADIFTVLRRLQGLERSWNLWMQSFGCGPRLELTRLPIRSD